MGIEELIADAHQTAVEKGWWDEPRSFGDCIALVHSELSEAIEEYRGMADHREISLIDHEYSKDNAGGPAKPVGVAVELADAVIRIADLCGRHGIPLAEALKEKLAYNKSRPHRHGGKRM